MAQTILFKKAPLLIDLPRKELDNLASTRQIVTLQAGNLQPATCLWNPQAIPGRCLLVD